MRMTMIKNTFHADLCIRSLQTRFSTERPGEFQNPMIAPIFLRHELADVSHPVRLSAGAVLRSGMDRGSWVSPVGASV